MQLTKNELRKLNESYINTNQNNCNIFNEDQVFEIKSFGLVLLTSYGFNLAVLFTLYYLSKCTSSVHVHYILHEAYWLMQLMQFLNFYFDLSLTFYFFTALCIELQINKCQTTMVANRSNQNNNKEITMTGNVSSDL